MVVVVERRIMARRGATASILAGEHGNEASEVASRRRRAMRRGGGISVRGVVVLGLARKVERVNRGRERQQHLGVVGARPDVGGRVGLGAKRVRRVVGLDIERRRKVDGRQLVGRRGRRAAASGRGGGGSTRLAGRDGE